MLLPQLASHNRAQTLCSLWHREERPRGKPTAGVKWYRMAPPSSHVRLCIPCTSHTRRA